MKTIGELAQFANAEIIGNADTQITDITHDSRKAKAGSLFVCIEGEHVDGHDFIAQAVANGAVAVMTAKDGVAVPENVAVIKTNDMTAALTNIAPFFHDYPARSMRMIGITGTNGKTTTSYLIRDILRRAGFKVGLIGTIKIMIEDESFPIHNTTPDVVELQSILATMRDKGTDYVVMEVSSHALDQNRIAGINFDAAIFTNLTQDHLDYHKTFENYRNAKGKLFSLVKKDGCAIINADDDAAGFMLEKADCRRITYAIKNEATLWAKSVDVRAAGTRFSLTLNAELPKNNAASSLGKTIKRFGSMDLSLKITGLFNVYNVMGAAAAAIAEGVNIGIIKVALENFGGVPGRFELVRAGQNFAVIVDYAHTPDGIANVLATAREITQKRIITVFGCGGDRDPLKRPIMGRIAAELSDVVIATSDNPRTEDPAAILDAVKAGVEEKIGGKLHEYIIDRREAIFRAIQIAEAGDIVAVLGKGHEDYQILKDRTIHFDDRETARNAIKAARG